MSRIEHALLIGLLLYGCVPTDEGKPTPEGTSATPQQPAARGPAGQPQLNRLPRGLPVRPAPAALAEGGMVGDAAARMPHGIADRLRGIAQPPAQPGAQPPKLGVPPQARGTAGMPPGARPVTPTATQPADQGPPDAPIKTVYLEFFERPELGAQWNATSPVWRVDNGRLCGQGARNHPVWLRRKLPTNARIEFDAMSSSPDGDLKVEVWGDGKGFAKGTSYTDATSYLAIFGGWKNQYHVLARLDEHAKDRPEVRIDPSGANPKAARVMPNRWYHFKIERNDSKTVRWLVDDIEIISFADPSPLKGEGHGHVGFNDWDVPVCFDNLKITPLGD